MEVGKAGKDGQHEGGVERRVDTGLTVALTEQSNGLIDPNRSYGVAMISWSFKSPESVTEELGHLAGFLFASGSMRPKDCISLNTLLSIAESVISGFVTRARVSI